jgi:hypothetical protein
MSWNQTQLCNEKHKIPNSNKAPAKFRVKKGNHQRSYMG